MTLLYMVLRLACILAAYRRMPIFLVRELSAWAVGLEYKRSARTEKLNFSLPLPQPHVSRAYHVEVFAHSTPSSLWLSSSSSVRYETLDRPTRDYQLIARRLYVFFRSSSSPCSLWHIICQAGEVTAEPAPSLIYIIPLNPTRRA